ncbi:Septum formation [Micromonospora pallida]|uniref:Septum formation n=1 Tax=Micromonospora pallida TaxID=145854 RepID=A0A1C6SM07_9ACTN|nr:septum formation family protein [Micromonospora pallida]SCL30448.1 Septum formation [Micromonospora pallida]
MRRWLRACALGVVAALAVTGCGAPEGTDGDLTDDWPAVTEPVIFQPENGVCHQVRAKAKVGYLSSYGPVPCDQWHEAETVHVGTLPAEHRDRATPPPAGSPARRAAHAECEKAANRALGGDWRTGRTFVDAVFPSEYGWRGGARWFRCDVGEIATLHNPYAKPRTSSIRGALAGDAPLAHRCFNPQKTGDDITAMEAVSCDSRHHAEFVGLYRETVKDHADLDDNQRARRRCRPLIAKYIGVPNNATVAVQSGFITYYPTEELWQDGTRTVQCFLWFPSRDLTRSLKGGGPRALPVR